MANISTLIFDLDGTLYKSRQLAAAIHAAAVDSIAAQLALQTDEAANRLRTAKTELSRQSGWEATLSRACLELGADLQLLHRHMAEAVAPEPFLTRDERLVAMLRRMGSNYALYLYTNNNRHLSERIMAAIGVENCFRKVYTIEDFWRSKPDRTVLAAILTDIGVTAAECLFVGDRYDVDLRLPAELGGSTFQSSSVDELLELETFLQRKQQERTKE